LVTRTVAYLSATLRQIQATSTAPGYLKIGEHHPQIPSLCHAGESWLDGLLPTHFSSIYGIIENWKYSLRKNQIAFFKFDEKMTEHL
jgi:hypothetical protein